MSVAGCYLEVEVDGTSLAGPMEWQVTESGEALDRTAGDTAGYHKADAGVLRAEGSIRFVQDTSTGFYAAVRARTILTNLKLFLNSSDPSPAYLFPEALVLSSGREVRVKGQGVMLPITFESRGSFTVNEPNTPA
jgi:voltage-gated potassium channel Kch